MDEELNAELGWGWSITRIPSLDIDGPMDVYSLGGPDHEAVIKIDRALPSPLYEMNLMQHIEREMKKGEIITASRAMFGGPDVQPEPDGA